MKTNNDQEQMIREEFALTEVGKACWEGSWTYEAHESGYVAGRMKSMEEIERLNQEINRDCFQDTLRKSYELKIKELESKIPDREELREAIEAYDEIATLLPLNKEIMNNLVTIKTFLEKLV